MELLRNAGAAVPDSAISTSQTGVNALIAPSGLQPPIHHSGIAALPCQRRPYKLSALASVPWSARKRRPLGSLNLMLNTSSRPTSTRARKLIRLACSALASVSVVALVASAPAADYKPTVNKDRLLNAQ